MRKLLLLSAMLISQSVLNCTGPNDQDQVFIHLPSHLEGAAIIQGTDRCFRLVHEEETIEIRNCFVDTLIRNCTQKYLISFLASGGYLVVKQFNDGDIYIKAKMRLLGGGMGFWGLVWAIATNQAPPAVIFSDELHHNDHKRHNVRMKKILKKRGIIIDADTFTPRPVVPVEKEVLILETKCVVGPGIPIGPCPIPFPGTRVPYQKAPKEVVRQPIPIIIGPTIIV